MRIEAPCTHFRHFLLPGLSSTGPSPNVESIYLSRCSSHTNQVDREIPRRPLKECHPSPRSIHSQKCRVQPPLPTISPPRLMGGRIQSDTALCCLAPHAGILRPSSLQGLRPRQIDQATIMKPDFRRGRYGRGDAGSLRSMNALARGDNPVVTNIY